jgi:hypothetical protein
MGSLAVIFVVTHFYFELAFSRDVPVGLTGRLLVILREYPYFENPHAQKNGEPFGFLLVGLRFFGPLPHNTVKTGKTG